MNKKFYIWQQYFADGDDYGYPELGPSSVPGKALLIGESDSLSEAIAIAKEYEFPGKYAKIEEELNPKINGIEYLYSYTIDYGFNCNKYLITDNEKIKPKHFYQKKTHNGSSLFFLSNIFYNGGDILWIILLIIKSISK